MKKKIYLQQKKMRKYFIKGNVTTSRLYVNYSGVIHSDLLKWFSIAENVSKKLEKLWLNLVIKPKIFVFWNYSDDFIFFEIVNDLKSKP